MAQSPKKGRPASVTLVRTPAPAPVIAKPAPVIEAPAHVEPPAPAATEVSSLALQAAEAPAPVAEAAPAPVAQAPVAPAPVAALADNVRSLVEKSLAQTKLRFGDVKTATQEASAAVEASYGAVHSGVAAFNAKALEALTSGAQAQFDHFASLASAKSFSEVLTLQGEFARKRFEEATAQAKQMTELARKVADESVAPIKAHVAKTFKVAV